ncbi:hypothetical protein ACXYRK_04155, partial [Mycoplasma sp. AC1221]
NYNGDLYQLIMDVVNDKVNIDEKTKENFYNEVLAYLNSASDKNTYTFIKKDDDNNYLISDSDLDKFASESYNQYQSKYLRYFATTPNEESGVKILADTYKEFRKFAKNFIGLDDQQEDTSKPKPEDIPLLNLVNGNYYAQRIRTWFSYIFTDYYKGRIINKNISYSDYLNGNSKYLQFGFSDKNNLDDQNPVYDPGYINSADSLKNYSNEAKNKLKQQVINLSVSDSFKYSFLPYTFNLNGVYDPKMDVFSYDKGMKILKNDALYGLKDPSEDIKKLQTKNLFLYAPISLVDEATDSGGKFMAVDENQRKYFISLIEYKQALKKLNDALKVMDYKKNGDQQASLIEKIEELNKNNDARYSNQKNIFNDFKTKLNTYTSALIAILDINNFIGTESVFPQTKKLNQILVDMLPYGKNSNFEFMYKDANEKLNNEVLGWYT